MLVRTIAASTCLSEPSISESESAYYVNEKRSPEWSPDGTQLVVSIDGKYLVEADGSAIHTIGAGTYMGDVKNVVSPNISPDGSQIIFATLRHRTSAGHNYEISVSKLNGSDYRRLTKTRAFEGNPVWSPDGTRIAFLSDRRAY